MYWINIFHTFSISKMLNIKCINKDNISIGMPDKSLDKPNHFSSVLNTAFRDLIRTSACQLCLCVTETTVLHSRRSDFAILCFAVRWHFSPTRWMRPQKGEAPRLLSLCIWDLCMKSIMVNIDGPSWFVATGVRLGHLCEVAHCGKDCECP